LRNVYGVKDLELIGHLETAVFQQEVLRTVRSLRRVQTLQYEHILETHRQFFNSLYPWAGQDRSITAPHLAIVKAGYKTLFCHPADCKRAGDYALQRGHPLLRTGEITAEQYAECGHVVASRRGLERGPVDEALAALGLARTVVAVVPSFRAALAVASVSDLLALVTDSFFSATQHQVRSGRPEVKSFPLPVRTEAITVSQMWHPRLDADPAHRWLRGLVLAACREAGSVMHTDKAPTQRKHSIETG
jgi:hypothetical protein